jgi:GT2 family glycosyltransferase
MLNEIKSGSEYFDEDFRFFYEDLDIAWRANNLGWKGYYIPNAVAYHIRGGTARRKGGQGKRYARFYLSDELHFDLIKNRYLGIIKNDSFFGFLFHLPFIIIYDIIILGYILFFKPQLIKKILRAQIPVSSAFRKRVLMRLLKN